MEIVSPHAQQMMNQFINGLKSKNDEVRLRTANDLYHFVSTELRELLAADVTWFLDTLNHHVFEMVSSSDMNEKKGGILGIGVYYFPYFENVLITTVKRSC